MKFLFTVMMAWISIFCAGGPSFAAGQNASPPKLLIVISIDQFGSNLFNQYRSHFKYGLKQLSSGIVYPNAYQAHGVTETCAGHAVILSGHHPRTTGIIANNWYDERQGKDRYCTEDGVHVAASEDRPAGVGPGLLEVSTLGDWLKAATPDSRVYTVAGKDRSAIMMGGKNPDGAFWFDGQQSFDTWGDTKAAAQARLAPLTNFNKILAAKLKKGPPIWTYADKTCRSLEQDITLSSGKVIHSRLPPDAHAPFPGKPADAAPPPPPWFIDSATLDAAYTLIKSQKLGRGQAVDILAIGLSGTDMVGHAYGTEGPEMCDHLARLDKNIGRLLERIKKLKIPVIIAVTADHGSGDIAERLAQRGYPRAHRRDPKAILANFNKAVRSQVGIDWNPLRAAFMDPSRLSVVNRDGKELRDVALRDKIIASAAEQIKKMPDVVGVETAAQLSRHKIKQYLLPGQMSLEDQMSLSYFAGRTGEILVAFDPFVTLMPPFPGLYMMGHSAPYNFNRRVPILLWGSGVPAQERALPVMVVDLAPTLAHLIGITPPDDLDGRCLDIDGPRGKCNAPQR